MFIAFIAIGILTGLMSAVFALLAGFGVLAALGFYCICGSIGTILAVVWCQSQSKKGPDRGVKRGHCV